MNNKELEFSRATTLSELGTQTLVEHLDASGAEREALAERFGVLSIDNFEADIALKRTMGDLGAELEGDLSAEVRQECVVTGEPVSSHVSAHFHVRYLPRTGDRRIAEEIEIVPDDEDIELYEGEEIEYGDVIAQHLSLAIPDYPRKAGAELPPDSAGEVPPEEETADDNPFSVLQELKDKS